METLSKETFLNIISHLALHQKVQCVLVCKQWEQQIRYTILYQDLNINRDDMLCKAVALFEDNPKYSKQVQKLRIVHCRPDTYVTLALPEIFFNLKTFISIPLFSSEIKLPRKPIWVQQFQNWKALETISCSYYDYDHLALLILESSVLYRLKTFEAKLHSGAEESEPEPMKLYTSNLISYLTNTPALTKLTLGNISVSISGLNTIHKNAPNLRILSLRDFFLEDMDSHFYLEDLDSPNKCTASVNLTHFSIHLNVKKYENTEGKKFNKTIRTLLLYVRTKYPVLQKLSIKNNHFSQLLPAVGPLEGDIIRTIRKLPFLTSYGIKLFPITDSIMEAMDETQIKLKAIRIWLHEFDTRRQFNFLLYSKQINSIHKVTLTDTYEMRNPLENSFYIFNLVKNLKHITVLDLFAGDKNCICCYKLLIEIILELNNLESLSIFDVYDNTCELPVALKNYQPKKTKLTQLRLQVTGTRHRPEYTNNLFKFILGSSPALKHLDIRGDFLFDSFTRLSLDLTQNRLLEEAFILLHNIAYYTFDKMKPHVMYARDGIKLKVPDSQKVKNTYYIELLYNPLTRVILTNAEIDDSSELEND